ncbi:alanine racemase [Pleionea sp. CnH1-48]|uniref:alanine racemase n=1 Tax=Pleionea sp. CnH1-48 TaxID=2954494 RepID=UPI002097A67B|nr:alanine racemase [Pleionea sp. CnH1-48]MCO7226445.1 alanine racemase [Pleionea sp. CnH1-48]
MRPTRATIDLSALRHNLSIARQLAPKSSTMAVVKANAYGHGLLPVARALSAADALAVACLEEAVEIRQAGIHAPIVLLEGFIDQSELDMASLYNLQTVIHHQAQIDILAKSSSTQPLIVWLKLDSRMNRLGFDEESYLQAYQALKNLPQVKEIRLMTHLACADEISNDKTSQQLSLFKRLVHDKNELKTVANSAAVLAWPESHYDWVRPGILLYGCSPLSNRVGADHKLQPVMTLESRLIAIKSIKKGDSVGYGAHWVADKDSYIGIVAIGYGDGYPRHAKNGTPVWINGRLAKLAGRVSMDMIAIDLGSEASDSLGDRVVLWGSELPVEEVARHADTIPYTLLCGVTSRVSFHCVNEVHSS